MSEDLESTYQYLWNDPKSGWCVLEAGNGGYYVFNKLRSVLLHFTDSVTNQQVCDLMLKHGVEIIDHSMMPEVEAKAEELEE